MNILQAGNTLEIIKNKKKNYSESFVQGRCSQEGNEERDGAIKQWSKDSVQNSRIIPLVVLTSF